MVNYALLLVASMCIVALFVYTFAIPWRIYYWFNGRRREALLKVYGDYHELVFTRGIVTLVATIVMFYAVVTVGWATTYLSTAEVEVITSDDFAGVYRLAGTNCEVCKPTDLVESQTGQNRKVLRVYDRHLRKQVAEIGTGEVQVLNARWVKHWPSPKLRWRGPRVEFQMEIMVGGERITPDANRVVFWTTI